MRSTALALALLVSAASLAWGAPPDPASSASRVASLCKAGEHREAAVELRRLLSALESEFGPGNPAVQLVRLNLGHLERALGREDVARKLEKLPPGDADARPLEPGLERALRGLRSCAAPPRRKACPELPFRVLVTDAIRLNSMGDYKQALEFAECARAIAGPRLAAEDRLQLYRSLALIHLTLGDRKAARTAAREAEKIAVEIGAVETRITLARLAAEVGDLEHAGTLLDELESVVESSDDRAELEEARGDLALRMGSPALALTHFERAVDGHRQSLERALADSSRRHGAEADPGELARLALPLAAVLQLEGDAHRMAGDFPAARQAYQEAFLKRSSAGAQSQVARTLNAIGLLECRVGDWGEADRTFDDALERFSESLGPNHHETIAIRMNRSLARFESSHGDAAAVEYAKAVEALARSLGQAHPRVAAARITLSHIEFERGELKRAEALLKRAFDAQTRTLGAAHPDLATTRLYLGRLLAHRGQLEEAAREIDDAVEVLARALGPNHPLVAKARITRSLTAAAQGDGETAFREAAGASGIIDMHIRLTFGAISERQRSLLARDSHGVINALFSAPGAPPRELFIASLPHRDAVLRSIAVSRAAARELPKGGSELLEVLENLRARYAAAVLEQGPDSGQRVEAIARKIEGIEALLPAPADDLSPAQAFQRACERLPPDAALVKFIAYDRTRRDAPGQPQPAYAALVIRGSKCEVSRVELGDADGIDKPAEELARAMSRGSSDAAGARETLSRKILTPLEGVLGGVARWLVVPDGSLWSIPLEALPDPAAPDRYLLERVTLGYLTSTFELAGARSGGSRPRSGPSLLIGAPEFGSTGAGPVVLTAVGPCQIPPFGQLPATRGEIEEVAERVPDPTLLTGTEATKERFVQELRTKPRLVHFATHAYFAGQAGCAENRADAASTLSRGRDSIAANPLLLSGIAMSGANHPTRVGAESRSGILTAYDIAGLDLRSADLVVLSACDTGIGVHLRGQEVQGLRWGFRAAGARALVTSLWISNDVATRRLMRSFYDSLTSEEIGRDLFRGSEALRRARLEYVKRERQIGIRRPLVWANFIFSGVL